MRKKFFGLEIYDVPADGRRGGLHYVGMIVNGEEFGFYVNERNLDGLWFTPERQVLGTCQFSLGATKAAARRSIARYFEVGGVA